MSSAALSYAMSEQEDLSFESVLLKALMAPEVAKEFSHVKLPFSLMPHQQENIHCGLSWERFGLFDDMRTGKTIVLQLLAIFYRHYGYRTIALMPPVLFDQFEQTFRDIKGHGVSVAVLEGSSEKKRDLIYSWALGQKDPPDILLMSREMFIGPTGKNAKGVLKYAEALKKCYDVLMWDECHLGLQDEESIIYKTVSKFVDRPDTRLILSTGTPTTNELRSAYPIISLKSPAAYQSRRHFDMSHVIFKEISISVPPSPRNPFGRRKIQVVDTYKNYDLLSKNLMHQAHRVTRKEVLDLQAPNLQVIPVSLDPSHAKAYRDLVKKKIIEMEADHGSEVIYLKNDQSVRQFALRLITDPGFVDAKVNKNTIISATEALLDSANVAENKVILFANFNNSVEFLARELKHLHPATIYGQNGPEKNRREADRFKQSAECRIAIINPSSGGVGFTFGDVCQTAIFVEPVSTPGQFEQAAARVILKGQTNPVVIYIFKVLGTISEKAIESMLEKGQEVQEVVKDKESLLKDLFPKK